MFTDIESIVETNQMKNIPIVDIAGVFIKKDNKIIMVQEKKPSAYGLWNIPAGHVNENETIENAAIRETKEETGFDVKLIEKIGVFALSQTHQIHIFKAEIIDGKINFDKDELLDAQWFSPNEILKLPLIEKFILELL
jgi:8-oxo-dGTP diphosphatase